jgi:hypothetical protein
VALRNRLARLRQQLIQAEGRSLEGGSAEIARVRADRRRIERMLGRMPTGADDFSVRNDQLLGRYRQLERELGQLEVERAGLEARIVATGRFLDDTADQRRDPAGAEAARGELRVQQNAADQYGERIEELRRLVELARVQVGVGDMRYQRDDRLRNEYNALVEEERRLLAAAGIRRPRQVDSMFGRIVRVEAALAEHDAEVDEVVNERVREMRDVIEEETGKLAGYRSALGGLEGETEAVVGEVTYANFNRVRARFYDLVLRADVGRIDVSWARREEHRMRVDMLTRERSQRLQALDDEFREIMDLQDHQEGTE